MIMAMEKALLNAKFVQLASTLPKLTGDITLDDQFSKTEAVREYLNFYKLCFSEHHPELAAIKHGFGRFESHSTSAKTDQDNCLTFQVACHYWQQPETSKGSIFLLHGYYDHSGLYRRLIRQCLLEGLNVVIFDLPGHGLSSGSRANIESFQHYTDALGHCINLFQNQLSQPFHICGQSTGGAVVLDYFWRCREQQRDNPFEKIVLLAPLVRAKGWRELGWALPLIEKFTAGFKRKFQPSCHDKEFLHFLKEQDPLQADDLPLEWIYAMRDWIARVLSQPSNPKEMLLIQGDQDNTIDWQYNNQQLLNRLPNLKIKKISGAGHHLVGEEQSIRSQAYSSIFEYLKN